MDINEPALRYNPPELKPGRIRQLGTRTAHQKRTGTFQFQVMENDENVTIETAGIQLLTEEIYRGVELKVERLTG